MLIGSESLREAMASYYRQIVSWEGILAFENPAGPYIAATAGLLSKEQLVAIEDTSDTPGPELIDADQGDAVAIAEELAAMPEATRWLPAIHNRNYLVKAVNAGHRERAEAIIVEIEALLGGDGATP